MLTCHNKDDSSLYTPRTPARARTAFHPHVEAGVYNGQRRIPDGHDNGQGHTTTGWPPARHGARTCDVCEQVIATRNVIFSLVPDSSVVDEFDPGFDGQRAVTVCCSEHLHLLSARGREAWIDEQLWLGRLARASTRRGLHDANLATLAHRAHLTPEQLQRLLVWNSTRHDSATSLPGGQSLTPERDSARGEGRASR
jgi:hypothetical protein